MKRILLAGAALATVYAAPAFAQGQPRPQPQTFEQAMQAQAAQAHERQARDDAAAREMLQHDLQVGNMTAEQQQQLGEYARQRVEQAMGNSNLSGMARDARRDIERLSQNVEQGVSGMPDPANSSQMTDAQFGQTAAHGVVNGVGSTIQGSRDLLRTVRPAVVELTQASSDIMRERERIIAGNPNVSDKERAAVRRQTQQAEHAAATINQRLDEADYRLRDREQRFREKEEQVAQTIERVAREQGRDPTQWTPPGRGTTPTPTSTRAPGRVLPVPTPPTPPAPTPETSTTPSPAPTTSSTARGSSGGQRGTIPPQDPYADFRVPRAQGGTGANNPPPRQAQTPNRQQQQQQEAARQRAEQEQAQRNADRTELARQQAMENARQDNAEMDAAWDAAGRAAERQRQAEMDAVLQDLEDAVHPGQVGRGGGGPSGGQGDGAGGSYDEQMAGGDGLPEDGAVPSLVDWMGPDPTRAAEDGYFGSSDAFGAAADASQAALDAAYDPWRGFEEGGILTIADLLPIYEGYDIDNAPLGSSGRSPSSAGTSLSSAGNSLSSAGNSLSAAGNSLSLAGSITPSSAPEGMRVDWDGFNLSADPFRVSNGGQPEPGSLADMLAQLNGPRPSQLQTDPWADHGLATNNRDLANLLYGPLWSSHPYQVQADPTGMYGRAMSDVEVASLGDTELDSYLRLLGSDFEWLRVLIAGDRGGLDRLLAQPFNVLLTWGSGAYDLDLHMTGPLTGTDRFHIYFDARGDLTTQPFAQLIKDCICSSGSEVILTSALNRGSGVYRVSVFNYGDQSGSSTNLSNQSQATVQIVRGGTAQSQGNGTTIVGGQTLLTVTVPTAQPGNTWIAAEINPNTGRITAPGTIVQSGGSGNVH